MAVLKKNNRIASVVISNAADNLSWSESHVMTVRDPTYVCNSMVIVANEGVLFVCVCVCPKETMGRGPIRRKSEHLSMAFLLIGPTKCQTRIW